MFALTPLLCNQLCGPLSQILVNEMQKQLLPVVAGKLDGIKGQIQTDIAQKITITDHVIKENIANICKSKVSFRKIFFFFFAKSLNICFFHQYRIPWIYSVVRLRMVFDPAYNKPMSKH